MVDYVQKDKKLRMQYNIHSVSNILHLSFNLKHLHLHDCMCMCYVLIEEDGMTPKLKQNIFLRAGVFARYSDGGWQNKNVHGKLQRNSTETTKSSLTISSTEKLVWSLQLCQ